MHNQESFPSLKKHALSAVEATARGDFGQGMAQINVDKIPAGPELDALTAERVFGWKSLRGHKNDPWGKKKDKAGRWRSARVPDYSTEPTLAYEIEERIKDLGLFDSYTKELSRIARAKGLPTDWASPDQRCRAAIKAIKKRRQRA